MPRLSLGLFTSLALMTAAPAWAGPVRPRKVVVAQVALGEKSGNLQRLQEQGYDIAGVNLKTGSADILLNNQQDVLSLGILGMTVLNTSQVDPSLAPDADYKSPEKIDALLHDWARRYPSLVQVESIGKSGEGRDIWAAKLAAKKTPAGQPRPAVMFNGTHHAREVMSTEVVVDTGEQLLSKYGRDARVTKWLDETDVWLIPIFNPDGSHVVFTSNSMWRKNTRDEVGVDLNRNYTYHWDTCFGSSGSPLSDAYRGPSAGSEPETQAMMAFVARIKPVFDISYHAYSEVVLFPYGCQGDYAEARGIFEPLAKRMADLVPSETGDGNYTAGTPWELLYSADGTDMDWMYHEQHVLAFAIEVTSNRSGFHPPYSHRDEAVAALRPAWSVLLDRLQESGLTGTVHAAIGATASESVLAILPIGASAELEPLLVAIKKDGTYHAVLQPGRYRVRFQGGGQLAERDVTVGSKLILLDL